jgi:hypothetical protein
MQHCRLSQAHVDVPFQAAHAIAFVHNFIISFEFPVSQYDICVDFFHFRTNSI